MSKRATKYKSRFDNTLQPHEDQEFNNLDYGDLDYLDSEKLLETSQQILDGEDKVFVGVEGLGRFLETVEKVDTQILRLNKIERIAYPENKFRSIWGRSKSAIWLKQKKKRMGRKRDLRKFTNFELKADDIFVNKGLIKYTNPEKFSRWAITTKAQALRNNKKEDDIRAFINPIAENIRSGSIGVLNLLESHYRRQPILKLKLSENSEVLDRASLNHSFKKEKLDRSLLLNSLFQDKGPERYQKNQLNDLHFYIEKENQGVYQGYQRSMFNYLEELIIVDDSDGVDPDTLLENFENLNRVVVSEYLFSKKNITKWSGFSSQDFSRNLNTRFSENPWESSETIGGGFPYDRWPLNFTPEATKWSLSPKSWIIPFRNQMIPIYKRVQIELWSLNAHFWLFWLKLNYCPSIIEIIKSKPKFLQKLNLTILDIYRHILTTLIRKNGNHQP